MKLISVNVSLPKEITHNGKTVLSAEWGPAVSKNPFLSFRFAGG